MTAVLLMTDPAHFEVRYAINPWMRPDRWLADAAAHRRFARRAWDALGRAILDAGGQVETAPGADGWPDMVFPANAAVVLDGKVLLARFRHPERQGEEPAFRAAFQALQARGLVREIHHLPAGLLHEGAGDAHWDPRRRLFWTGHGPRSHREAGRVIGELFGVETVPLELASERFYHLDTCFLPLTGGEVLYFPPAFTAGARRRIRERVDPDLLVEAAPDEAAAFCVNAVNIGRRLVMAEAPPRLTALLAERGYQVAEVDLSPFILSGGGAFCMTLRLDHASLPAAVPALTEGAAP
jgi:N-dimethylarginine dimethylaminohydrolase